MRGKKAIFGAVRFIFALIALFIPFEAWGFAVPEKLIFDVTWSGLKVGEVSAEISEDGRDMKMLGRGQTSGWVSVFYKISDTLVSRVDKESFKDAQQGLPYSFDYRKTFHEGKLRLDEEIALEAGDGESRYLDHLKKHEAKKKREETVYDPLSLFYYIRRLPLTVGSSVRFKIVDREDVYDVQVRVLKKETVKTSLGTFDTILLKPVFGYIPGDRGLMYIKGDTYIWLTDDEKRLPVLVQKTADVPLPGVIPKSLREGMKKARMTLKKAE